MERIKILFVCMGNICRSPAAACVFRARADARGLSDAVQVESAGTIGYHAGNPPDSRMAETGKRRGYRIHGQARQVKAADLQAFDLVIAMDRENLRELFRLDPAEKARDRIHLFLDFHPNPPFREVPDPYYGGPAGFEKVIDLVEAASDGLLDSLTRAKS